MRKGSVDVESIEATTPLLNVFSKRSKYALGVSSSFLSGIMSLSADFEGLSNELGIGDEFREMLPPKPESLSRRTRRPKNPPKLDRGAAPPSTDAIVALLSLSFRGVCGLLPPPEPSDRNEAEEPDRKSPEDAGAAKLRADAAKALGDLDPSMVGRNLFEGDALPVEPTDLAELGLDKDGLSSKDALPCPWTAISLSTFGGSGNSDCLFFRRRGILQNVVVTVVVVVVVKAM